MQPNNDAQPQQDPSESNGEQDDVQAPPPPLQQHEPAGFHPQPYEHHLVCYLSQVQAVLENTLMVAITYIHRMLKQSLADLCSLFNGLCTYSLGRIASFTRLFLIGHHGRPSHRSRIWKLVRAHKHRGLALHQHVRCCLIPY